MHVVYHTLFCLIISVGGQGGRCPSVDQCCISVVVGKRGGGGIRTFQYSTLSKYIPLIAGTLSNQIAYDVYNVHPTNA